MSRLARLVLAGGILATSLLLTNQALAFPGEPAGFTGLNWGTSINQLGTSMRYVGGDNSGNALYERSGEELSFGRARLESVQYGFVNGRLKSVTLKASSMLQYLLLKEEAQRKYGVPSGEVAEANDSYVWKGDTSEVLLISKFSTS